MYGFMRREPDELSGLSFLKASKNRMTVFVFLASSEHATPSDISKSCGLRPEHVSRALTQLQSRGLVICKTPYAHKGRLYGLTQFGKEVSKAIPRSIFLQYGCSERGENSK